MLSFVLEAKDELSPDALRIALVGTLLSARNDTVPLVRIANIEDSNIDTDDAQAYCALLKSCAVPCDAPLLQSERRGLYKRLAYALLENKKAYLCFCEGEWCNGRCAMLSKNEVARKIETKAPYVIRAKEPKEHAEVNDKLRGTVVVAADALGEITLWQRNDTPTPIFASACDEMLNDISLVLSNDTIETRAKITHLKTLLGAQKACDFLHLAKLEGANYTVQELLKEGFLPDAIVNYLLILSFQEMPQAPFVLPEAIEYATVENLNESYAYFEIETLRRLNHLHLQRMDEKKLSTIFGFADAAIGRLAKLYLDECDTVNALKKKIEAIFGQKRFEGAIGKETERLRTHLRQAPYFEKFDDLVRDVESATSLRGDTLFRVLRLLLTGSETGPELATIYDCIKPYLLEVIR